MSTDELRSSGSPARGFDIGAHAGRLRGAAILMPFLILFIVLSLTSSSFSDQGEPAQHPRPAVGDADHRGRRARSS